MRVVYVLEDEAHAQFVPPLFRRLAGDASVELAEQALRPMGGAGRTIDGLRRLLADIRRGAVEQPDAIVVGIDADCSRQGQRQRQVGVACEREDYHGLVVVAEPEPHARAGTSPMLPLSSGCCASPISRPHPPPAAARTTTRTGSARPYDRAEDRPRSAAPSTGRRSRRR